MKINVLDNAKVICSNRNSIFNYFAWPSVAKLPNGALAMVASGFRMRHVCPFGKGIICYSYDNGKTWTKPAIVIDTPLDDRDCGIVTYGNNVMITSFNNTVKMQNEWNEMQKDMSWEHSIVKSDCNKSEGQVYNFIDAYLKLVNKENAEKEFLGSVYVVSNDGGYTFGDIKKIPVSCPHGPAVMPDGRLIYIGNNNHTNEKGVFEPECYITDENGEFKYVSSIKNVDEPYYDSIPTLEEPHTLVLPNGKIIVHFRRDTSHPEGTEKSMFALYQSVSTDGGKSFSKPKPISDNPRIGAPAHLLSLNDGTIISAFGVRDTPYGIKIIASKDEGETWQNLGYIYKDEYTGDIGYPCSVELNNGEILTVFYAHTDSSAPAEIMQVKWKIDIT